MIVDRQSGIEACQIIYAGHKSVKTRAGRAGGHLSGQGGGEPERHIRCCACGQPIIKRNAHRRTVQEMLSLHAPTVNQRAFDFRCALVGGQVGIQPEIELVEACLLLVCDAHLLHTFHGRNVAGQKAGLDKVVGRVRQPARVVCECVQQRLTIHCVVGQINDRCGK